MRRDENKITKISMYRYEFKWADEQSSTEKDMDKYEGCYNNII